jgi:hypothetical protein
LAEREGFDLITDDKRLINGLGPVYPFIVALRRCLDRDMRCAADQTIACR